MCLKVDALTVDSLQDKRKLETRHYLLVPLSSSPMPSSISVTEG